MVCTNDLINVYLFVGTWGSEEEWWKNFQKYSSGWIKYLAVAGSHSASKFLGVQFYNNLDIECICLNIMFYNK